MPKGIGYLLFLRTKKGKTLICFKLVSILRKHGILMFIIITNCMPRESEVQRRNSRVNDRVCVRVRFLFFVVFFKEREEGGGVGGWGGEAVLFTATINKA